MKSIWQKCPLVEPLQRLFIQIILIHWNMAYRGRSWFTLYAYNKNIFRNPFVQYYWPNFKMIWHKCSMGDQVFKLFGSIGNHVVNIMKHLKNILYKSNIPIWIFGHSFPWVLFPIYWNTWPVGAELISLVWISSDIFKYILVQTYRTDFKILWHACSLAPKMFN